MVIDMDKFDRNRAGAKRALRRTKATFLTLLEEVIATSKNVGSGREILDNLVEKFLRSLTPLVSTQLSCKYVCTKCGKQEE